MSETPRAPFDHQEGDTTPLGDTPEHSDAGEDRRRRPVQHAGNVLGGEGEGSSVGGAPRRHSDAPTTRRRA